MKTPVTGIIAAIALLAASLATQAAPPDETQGYGRHLGSSEEVAMSRPGSFEVYIDPPTGFAFVHTPGGWKFTRKVPDDASAMVQAPAESAHEAVASY